MHYLPKSPFKNPALPIHHALALEAAACAEGVLTLFEKECPHDMRPREALATLRAWVQGQASMLSCRKAAFGAHAAARAASQPAAVAAARAAAVAHMYTHAPHVAAYAAKATAIAA